MAATAPLRWTSPPSFSPPPRRRPSHPISSPPLSPFPSSIPLSPPSLSPSTASEAPYLSSIVRQASLANNSTAADSASPNAPECIKSLLLFLLVSSYHICSFIYFFITSTFISGWSMTASRLSVSSLWIEFGLTIPACALPIELRCVGDFRAPRL